MRHLRAHELWWFLACWGLALVALTPLVARAQAETIALVRATSSRVPADLAAGIDAAVLRDLTTLADIRDPIVSPADFEEIQLTVGCDGTSRACLSSVARTLRADALVIQRLKADDGGITTLELIWFRTADAGEAATAQVTYGAATRSALTDAVPALVRKVFGIPEPSSTAGDSATTPQTNSLPGATHGSGSDALNANLAAAPEAGDGPSVRTLTWVALIAGAVTLGTGAVLGASAQSSFGDFKETTIRSEADASRLKRDIDSIQSRATIANVLMPVGGVLLGLSGVLLFLDLSRDRDAVDRDTARFDVAPGLDGLRVSFSTPFEGG